MNLGFINFKDIFAKIFQWEKMNLLNLTMNYYLFKNIS